MSEFFGPPRPPSGGTTPKRVIGPALIPEDVVQPTNNTNASVDQQAQTQQPLKQQTTKRVVGPTRDVIEDDRNIAIGPARPPDDTKDTVGPKSSKVGGGSVIGPARPPAAPETTTIGLIRPQPTPETTSIAPTRAPAQKPHPVGPSRPPPVGPPRPSGPLVGPPRPSPLQNRDEGEDEEEQARISSEWKRLREGGPVDDKPKARDGWMIDLPPERSAATVLTNRQFSRKDNATGRGDTSIWTDTPQESAKKKQKTSKDFKEEKEQVFASAKDQMSEKIMSTFNERFRAKSLVEQHQEEAQRKQKEDIAKGIIPEGPTYKPFDRDTDLEVRKANPQQTKSIMQKAKELNTRFSGGTAKKFL